MSRFQSVTPNLIVRDVERSTAFYRDVLGFAIKQTVPDHGPFVFVWLERDGVPVFLNAVHAVEEDFRMRRPGLRAAPPRSSSRSPRSMRSTRPSRPMRRW